jgi:Mlc titration factor MtfA (ptsG expression regulator)
LRYSGEEEKAYAATNPMEYFAELSETYFGTNDFYPFVRAELRIHDPKAFAMVETLWGVKPAAVTRTKARQPARGRASAKSRGAKKDQG